MNITPTAVNNAANLAMCIVNVSAKLTINSGGAIQGVRDLKTVVRGRKYIAVVLKLLPPKQYLRQNPIPSVIPCRLRWQPQRGISRGLP